MIDTFWPIATTALACVSTCGWFLCASKLRQQKAERREWHQRALVAGEELRFIDMQRHLSAKKARAAQLEQQRALVAETTSKLLRAPAK